MNADAKALLAAIVANPADDTVRLAFADCIEEQGNAPRAQFIRLQIEAERHHPDSAKHAALTEQAGALFAEHWIDWWTEVCEAVGLPLPSPKATTRLGRLARRVGLHTEGKPYGPDSTTVMTPEFTMPHALCGLERSDFRRGFPEAIAFHALRAGKNGGLLTEWAGVSPLTELHTNGPFYDGWHDGPHLAGVRSISLRGYSHDSLLRVLASPHLTNLQELHFPDPGYPGRIPGWERTVLNQLVVSPRFQTLKRLTVLLPDPATAEVLAFPGTRHQLEGLEVVIHDDPPGVSAGACIALLIRSRHLPELREFTITVPGGPILGSHTIHDPNGQHPMRQLANWAGLRKLTINADFVMEQFACLLEEVHLPALEELRFSSVFLSREVINVLIASPLLKQLRHFALSAWGVDSVSDADLRRLPQMFDLNRIETFAFNPDHAMPGLDELQRQLGERLRFPW